MRGLEPRLKIQPPDFLERRLIRGKALSAAVINMFALAGARDLYSGNVIDAAQYMKDGDPGNFVNVYSQAELMILGSLASSSPRIFANLILSDRESKHQTVQEQIKWLLNTKKTDVLSSQFISVHAATMLLSGDIDGFILERSMDMHAAAVLLIDGSPS